MGQVGKGITLAVIGAMTVITVAGILSFTATQFAGSGDNLQLDVEVKPDTVKMRAAVNNQDKTASQEVR
jgi:hypothetical protein